MSDLPFVSCVCCSYRHPTLLANAIACFLAQTYPADRRELVILEDSGRAQTQVEPQWRLLSSIERRPSLAEKHNQLVRGVSGDFICVWDDDDVYLQWHVEALVRAHHHNAWCKPSRILSTYNRVLHEEDSAGRFQGSIGFSRSLFDEVGGWTSNKRADFDQNFITKLGVARCGDPCKHYPPSYVYRWETTNAPHCSGLMKSPDDETWYDIYPTLSGFEEHYPERIVPKFDEETTQIYLEKGWNVTDMKVHR